jgi:hypothetical protein
MAMAVVFALAPMLSLVDANQPADATILVEKTDHTTPHPFEPKDVLIETPRQGKAKGL